MLRVSLLTFLLRGTGSRAKLQIEGTKAKALSHVTLISIELLRTLHHVLNFLLGSQTKLTSICGATRGRYILPSMYILYVKE